jgi:hypothetical protein
MIGPVKSERIRAYGSVDVLETQHRASAQAHRAAGVVDQRQAKGRSLRITGVERPAAAVEIDGRNVKPEVQELERADIERKA